MKKRAKGNTLALILVAIGVILLLVAFFALNYNQLFGGHKQVANAIDAAALTAAVDIGRVVVDTPLGRVALVDDVPAVASTKPQSGGGTISSPQASDARPIQGINTIMGELRLDAIIAGSLVTTTPAAPSGNTSISYLIGQDLARAQEAAFSLNTAINVAATQAGTAYDKFGNAVNIPADVQNAYNANSPKAANSATPMTAVSIADVPNTPNSIGFEIGYLSPSVATSNIPLPSTENPSQTYVPYQAYQAPNFPAKGTITAQFNPGDPTLPTKNLPGSFQFAAIASQPALVDQSTWAGNSSSPPNGTYAPASAVHVSANQTMSPIAEVGRTKKGGNMTTQMVSHSYAEAGGAASTPVVGFFDGLMQKAYAQSTTVSGPPTTPTGTLEISFASGGIPGLNAGNQYAAPNNQKLQMSNSQGAATNNSTAGLFNNVLTMMNASMASTTGTVSSDAPWTQTTGNTANEAGGYGVTGSQTETSPGFWYVCKNGPVPGSGTVSQESFKGLSNGSNVNPSVALSFVVYDWLKSLGLRPSVQSVVDALSLTANKASPSLPAGTFYQFEGLLAGSAGANWSPQNYTITSNPDDHSVLGGNPYNHLADNADWMPPAYAEAGNNNPGIINALEKFNYGDGSKDPRSLTNAAKDPNGIQRQQANVWGYVPADPAMPNNALMIKMDNGNPETTDGNSIGVLYQAWGALSIMSSVADATQTNSWNIIKAKLHTMMEQNQQFLQLNQQRAALQKQLSAATDSTTQTNLKSQLAAIDNQIQPLWKASLPGAMQACPRAYAALVNARYCLSVVESMTGNMKTLTALGASKINNQHYIIAGADFYPCSAAATPAELNGTGAAPDGQLASLTNTDWCTPPVNGTSQMDFYKHTTAPVIGHLQGEHQGQWLPAAVAAAPASQNPYDKLHFCFYVSGSSPGSGQVHLYVGPDPFVNSSNTALGTMEGQALYQDTQALQTNPTVTQVPATQTQIWDSELNSAVAGSSTYNITYQEVSTYTVWQVQARDEIANNYSTSSSSPTTSNPAAGYFASMTGTDGAQTEANPGWCGSNASSGSWQTPTCPALAAEWQLTCPMPVTFDWTKTVTYNMPPVTYHPAVPTTSSDQAVQIWNGVNSLGWSCGPYLGQHDFAQFMMQYFGLGIVDVPMTYGNIVTTNYGAPTAYTIGGVTFYDGSWPNTAALGNGWYYTGGGYTSSYTVVSNQTTTTVSHS